jgi:hypothetical protein
VNLGIGHDAELGKRFRCRRCGAEAILSEGFYWQRDVSG